MDVPLLNEDALAELSDPELAEYVAMLEDAAREKVKRDFKLFARHTEVPGVPDKSKIKASDWRRVLASERGETIADDDEDDEVEFYPQRLDPAAHHDLIMTAVQGCVEETLKAPDGETVDGVIIMAPPGSAKSTYSSMLGASYFLGRFPNFNVIGVSYAQSLADRFSKRAREICSRQSYAEKMGASLVAGSTGVQNWHLTNGSEFRAAGIQAAVTGFRADLLICDDPVAGAEEADSEVIRNKTWESWQTDITTRLKPGGKILVIQTRWHQDDLTGRIVGDGWSGQSGHWVGTDNRNWFIICLPAIAEHDDDPLGRKAGEILWPEHFRPRDMALRKKQAEAEGGSRAWQALYQQRPTVAEGEIIKRESWKQWTNKDERGHIEPPRCDQVLLFYDTAFEESELADYSAMTAWGVFGRTVRVGSREHSQHHAIMLGAWRAKIDAADLADRIKYHIDYFGADQAFIEKRASGTQILQELKRARVPVVAWLPKGKPGTKGKVPRMWNANICFEAGAVYYIPGTETNKVVDEVCEFPRGKHDDYADTVTMAMDVFRRRYLMQIPTDEWDDDEYEVHQKAEFEKRRQPTRRLYG